MKFAIIFLLIAAVIALVWGLAQKGGPPRRTIHELTSPGEGNRAEPNLALGLDGKLYLSWVEERNGEHVLRFSRWQDQWREGSAAAWSPPQDVARGADWFVNWADFPAMAALEDGTLFAHWLAKAGDGGHAYGVHVSISRDGGKTWSPPVVPHRDSAQAEHGFVSWIPAGSDHMGMVWLDGRDIRELGGGRVEGSMGLRYTTLDREGNLGEEVLLDTRVCDCCGTDAVVPEPGALLVVYRDRSLEEFRDISFVRSAAGAWSPPRPVHRDGWKIDGCPVNGPAADAQGTRMVVAWFTVDRADSGQVQAAFSEDGGRSFGSPFRVDDGRPLGRVDAVLQEDGKALVSWLEETEGEAAEIRLRELSASGEIGPSVLVARTRAERGSGFPRMERLGNRIYLAWTETGAASAVRTAVYY